MVRGLLVVLQRQRLEGFLMQNGVLEVFKLLRVARRHLKHVVRNHQRQLGFAQLAHVVGVLFCRPPQGSLHELERNFFFFEERHGLLEFNDQVDDLEEGNADVLVNCLVQEHGVLEPHLEVEVNLVFDELLAREAVDDNFAELGETGAVLVAAEDREVGIELVVEQLLQTEQQRG